MDEQRVDTEAVEGIEARVAARAGIRLIALALLIGLATGVATWLFIAADHYGIAFLWDTLPELLEGVPGWAVSVGVVFAMTVVATLAVVLSGKRPFDMGSAAAEYDNEGRMAYRHLLPGAVYALSSLFSGAAIGPEAALTDVNGGIGSWIADRFGVKPEQVKVMTYAGVAGAFAAFFGAAPVGALLAIELISPRSVNIKRTSLVVGLAAGATSWAVYTALGGGKLSPMLLFPSYTSNSLTDLAWALALGAAAGVLGLVYGAGLIKIRVKLQPLRDKPWLAGAMGATVLAVAAVASPYLLFSGQEEVPQVIAEAAGLGILVLVGLGIGKLVLSVWSLSTAYFGGPIFPLIFAGTCFGLALNLAVPSIPQGVAVMAIISGMVVAATVAPLSVTIFLALLGEPSLISVIAIAAVASFMVRQAIAPTIPGVYRQARAAEDSAAKKRATTASPS